jgi:hypothetical protein
MENLFSHYRTRKDFSRGEQVSKSRCNSCTDSSGVSSCDSGLGPTGKHGGPHEQTLSPIPSSTSLNTLRSGAVTDQAIGNQVSYRKLSSIHGKKFHFCIQAYHCSYLYHNLWFCHELNNGQSTGSHTKGNYDILLEVRGTVCL